MRTLIEAINLVKSKPWDLIIFPEGARHTDGKVHEFFGGFSLIAKKIDRSVVPIKIIGVNKVYPPKTFWIHFHPITVIIGSPMAHEPQETEEAFKDRVYNGFCILRSTKWIIFCVLPIARFFTGSFPLLLSLLPQRYWLKRSPFYQFPLVAALVKRKRTYAPTHKKIFAVLRLLVLALLIFLIAKPQLVDTKSNVIFEGIDIMLVLDISGSMQFQDYDDDKRSRIEVAKDEALHFVNKRTNDAIGLVIFVKMPCHASRSPSIKKLSIIY